jgi:hypothetical protein
MDRWTTPELAVGPGHESGGQVGARRYFSAMEIRSSERIENPAEVGGVRQQCSQTDEQSRRRGE